MSSSVMCSEVMLPFIFNLIEVKPLSVLQLVIAATFQRSKNAIKIINTLPLLSFRHKKLLLVFIFKKHATLAFNLKNYVQR